MSASTYFLVNDTRYDNHHGCLTVIKNLHLGLGRRGWTCVGSLPVSASVRQLRHYRRQLAAARHIIVNGEGSLHHNSRNTGRLFDICSTLCETHPVVLMNTIWQDNDPLRWQPLLERFRLVYVRDHRSLGQLRALGIEAGYAPDLTFYDYPVFSERNTAGFLCTDSVLNSWTNAALRLCGQDSEITFRTLFTGAMQHIRGPGDWHKVIKYNVYPALRPIFGRAIPPRYRALPYAIKDTARFLEMLAACRAVCVARYHALCFALQQNVPFVAVASNSHKSESLLEDVGLVADHYVIDGAEIDSVKDRLMQAVHGHPSIAGKIEAFNRRAKQRIELMFDQVTRT